jgi:hypothetical protein
MLPDEQHLSLPSLKLGSMFGGAIESTVSQGIFMAELQGVARALTALPYTWELHVVMDSKAAMQAIQSYLGEPNERKRLRMNGRPLLELISKMIRARKLLQGEVTWTHVKSHAAVGAGTHASKDQAGNSCADFMATWYRTHPDSTMVKSLPLHLGEYWLSMTDEHGTCISNDIRTQVKSRLKVMCMESWQASRSQSKFAGDKVLPLCHLVLAQDQCREDVSVMLRVVTNTFEYYWDAEDEKEHVKKQCCACDSVSVLDVSHVLTCAHWIVNRQQVVMELMCLLHDLDQATVQAWLDDFSHRHDDGAQDVLGDLMGELMLDDNRDDAPDTVDLHRIMFGGFSVAEGKAAMTKLGVDGSGMVKDALLDTMRMLLLEQFVHPSLAV